MDTNLIEKNCGHKLIYLAYGGSHAIGTNTPESDVDLRGVCLNSKDELLGLQNFEQYEPSAEDTVIYSVNKIVALLLNCNPNVLEIFGTKPEHIFHITAEGKALKDNIPLFLSKRCIKSFMGYGFAQLIRLENALVRNQSDLERDKHIAEKFDSLMEHFEEHYGSFENGSFHAHVVEKPTADDPDAHELALDVNLKDYPFSGVQGIFSEMVDIHRTYGQVNHRARKKDDRHLYKHAMHLIRLNLMLGDILDGNGVVTYREKEHDLLMDIRNGKYTFDEIFQMNNELKEKIEGKIQATALPAQPDLKKINDLLVELNMRSILDEQHTKGT